MKAVIMTGGKQYYVTEGDTIYVEKLNGNVGDKVDFYLEDGTKIPCIIADIKNPNDPGCNEWGHNNGQNVIEFEVARAYYNQYGNPGNNGWFSEWGGKRVASASNLGSIW